MIIEDSPETFRFTASMKLQRYLAELGIYFSLHPELYRLRDGEVLRARKGPCIEPFVIYNANSIFPLGFASYTNANLDPEVSVGRYCSIAHNVRVMGADHPTDRVTTNTISYGQFSNIHLKPVEYLGGSKVKTIPFKQKSFPVIENDVWVGQDVLLARGITLSTGCIVAAGSVVTRDVPPYAIVGGNPAKLIRYRFSDTIIEKLWMSGWWRYAFPHFSELPLDNPEAFIDELDLLIQAGRIHPYEPEKLDLYQIVASFD